YGRHAATALLANPAREIEMLLVTRAGGKWLADQGFREQLIAAGAREMAGDDLAALLPAGSVHQGVAILAKPLPSLDLAAIDEMPGTGPIIVLDQITDPQNVGAILRSAAAFDAKAVILQARHSPAITGALAKAAAGAAETIPIIRVVNIARTLDELKSKGYFCVGLAGDGDTALNDMPRFDHVALVMGAEGDGLRPLVARACDLLAMIPMGGAMQSLNVSAAAAIALYALSQPGPNGIRAIGDTH
ncbi:MAG: RNA methyltransferase, partial [Pseudomonadota bacterium]